MIRYSLLCEEQHRFDGWFADSESFERQKAESMIACPVCGSSSVEKALMAPRVSTSRKREAVKVAANVPQDAEMATMVRKLRKHLTENADYVGDKFPEEARRIHYNEVECRGIYGEATPDEAHALAEEGIEFHPLPTLPEDQN